MNKAQAEIFLRRYADYGIRLTKHCRKRMAERDVTVNDILYVIHWGEIVELKGSEEYGTWECTVKGLDIDGEELVFVAAIDENDASVVCITVKGD
ncbi:hypothetical protein PITCH_A1920097 [uncultured Desulfobacterium sp.]|uniref:DUF4258 domain-containing protein n=1 Tax=uncultured Desulfobacterium sp. TaxID=201089 RepID=A0A445MWB3_9BACT|nr:hypothetical protein PITCH_A1920097 [uncultured Desulfobacterium sp.]